MLEGYDEAWQPPTHETSVSYSLLPGTYTFKLIARNSMGIMNSRPLTYSFEIKQPFYKTWWFIVSAILVVTGIVFLWIKIRE
ncbi:MAG: triple tyrosine motif-containing protein, partial [Bacteroidota bacterium]